MKFNPIHSFRAAVAVLTLVAALPAAAGDVPTAGYWVVEVTNSMKFAVPGLIQDRTSPGSLFIHDLGYQALCPSGGQAINDQLPAGDNLSYASTYREAWSWTGRYSAWGKSGDITAGWGEYHDVYCIPANPQDYNPTLFVDPSLSAYPGYIAPTYPSSCAPTPVVSAPYSIREYFRSMPSAGVGFYTSIVTVDLPVGDKTYTVMGLANPYTAHINGYVNNSDSYYALHWSVKTGVGAAPTQTVIVMSPGVMYGTAPSPTEWVPLPADARLTEVISSLPPYNTQPNNTCK